MRLTIRNVTRRLAMTTAFAIAFSHPLMAMDFQRFVNLSTWFTWPRYIALDKPGIAAQSYDPAKHVSGRAALQGIKALGFRGVRLAVDPAPFLVLAGPERDMAVAQVMQGVKAATDGGLDVLLSLHPNSRHKIYGETALIRGVEDPMFRRYVDVVALFAQQISSLPNGRVALSLMNEPRLKCAGADQDTWNAKLDAMISAARAHAPSLRLVVSGACTSSIDGLLALRPQRWNDPALVFTFHYYEPFFFTHQGAPFIRWPEKHLGNLPWPTTRPVDKDAIMAEAEKSVATLPFGQREATGLTVRLGLERYLKSNVDRRLIERRFRQVAAWADQHGVERSRIFLGEFGVYGVEQGKQGASCADRTRWIADVADIARTHQLGWAFFHYDGPFGIKDQQAGSSAPVLHALGLTSVPASC